MPFNSPKTGYENELEFIKCLNRKKVKELTYDLQLFIKDIYEDKKQETVPDGDIDSIVRDMDGRVVNSIDLAFIFDEAVSKIRDHKISHNDAIEYLMDKLKTYNGGSDNG